MSLICSCMPLLHLGVHVLEHLHLDALHLLVPAVDVLLQGALTIVPRNDLELSEGHSTVSAVSDHAVPHPVRKDAAAEFMFWVLLLHELVHPLDMVLDVRSHEHLVITLARPLNLETLISPGFDLVVQVSRKRHRLRGFGLLLDPLAGSIMILLQLEPLPTDVVEILLSEGALVQEHQDQQTRFDLWVLGSLFEPVMELLLGRKRRGLSGAAPLKSFHLLEVISSDLAAVEILFVDVLENRPENARRGLSDMLGCVLIQLIHAKRPGDWLALLDEPLRTGSSPLVEVHDAAGVLPDGVIRLARHFPQKSFDGLPATKWMRDFRLRGTIDLLHVSSKINIDGGSSGPLSNNINIDVSSNVKPTKISSSHPCINHGGIPLKRNRRYLTTVVDVQVELVLRVLRGARLEWRNRRRKGSGRDTGSNPDRMVTPSWMCVHWLWGQNTSWHLRGAPPHQLQVLPRENVVPLRQCQIGRGEPYDGVLLHLGLPFCFSVNRRELMIHALDVLVHGGVRDVSQAHPANSAANLSQVVDEVKRSVAPPPAVPPHHVVVRSPSRALRDIGEAQMVLTPPLDEQVLHLLVRRDLVRLVLAKPHGGLPHLLRLLRGLVFLLSRLLRLLLTLLHKGKELQTEVPRWENGKNGGRDETRTTGNSDYQGFILALA